MDAGEDDGGILETREFALGLSGPLRIGFRLEGGREWTEIPDRCSGSEWKAGAFLTADFR